VIRNVSGIAEVTFKVTQGYGMYASTSWCKHE